MCAGWVARPGGRVSGAGGLVEPDGDSCGAAAHGRRASGEGPTERTGRRSWPVVAGLSSEGGTPVLVRLASSLAGQFKGEVAEVKWMHDAVTSGQGVDGSGGDPAAPVITDRLARVDAPAECGEVECDEAGNSGTDDGDEGDECVHGDLLCGP